MVDVAQHNYTPVIYSQLSVRRLTEISMDILDEWKARDLAGGAQSEIAVALGVLVPGQLQVIVAQLRREVETLNKSRQTLLGFVQEVKSECDASSPLYKKAYALLDA